MSNCCAGEDGPQALGVSAALGDRRHRARAVRAFTFCMDRNSGRYVSGLSEAQVADVLARAVGSRGSMVEYLCNTVRHLEDIGIYDSTCGGCRRWWPSGSTRWAEAPRIDARPRLGVIPELGSIAHASTASWPQLSPG